MNRNIQRMGVALQRGLNGFLARADMQVVRRSSLDAIGWNAPPSAPPTGRSWALPIDFGRVERLTQRYEGHPAAETGVLWSAEFQEREIDPALFRADNAYLWQTRDHHLVLGYALASLYARLFDPLKLWGNLLEDGAFGASVFCIDGAAVSRDLLDSMVELSFLEEALEISRRAKLRVLDIGAGYGRLAHRATAALPSIEYVCTDGIPLSTVLCEEYLRYREVVRATVVPLDEIAEITKRAKFDLAINIHSFSECPHAAITWWVELLSLNTVPYLMVVPSDGLKSQEVDGTRHDYSEILREYGYREIACRPKYAHSDITQRYGLFPAEHYLFELNM